jgi:hypothetical protein
VDRDKSEVLATSKKPVDFGSVESECVVSETTYEYVKPYWRSQVGQGLETRMPHAESVKLAAYLEYSLTKRGRAVLGKLAADDLWVAATPPGEYHPPPDAEAIPDGSTERPDPNRFSDGIELTGEIIEVVIWRRPKSWMRSRQGG